MRLFRCDPMDAFISQKQCEFNRSLKDNLKKGVWADQRCRGCAGLGALKPEVVAVMASKACRVDGCERVAQSNKKGMCKAHFTASLRDVVPGAAVGDVIDESGWVQPAIVRVLPVVSEVEAVAVDGLNRRAEVLSDMRTALVRTFETGATRSGGDKPEYAGYLSPRVVEAFGRYMFEHQVQPDGTVRDCRNWQKGIPQESYMQSMFRHFIEVWTIYENGCGDADYAAEYEQEMITSLMALLFNVQGMAHERIGARG